MSNVPKEPIKVFIVDDSAVVRQVLSKVLAADEGIIVVGVAADPVAAEPKMAKNWPDVIVLDVEMPRMDGITFLRKIMAERPTPVVICSTLTERGAETTMQALAAGAISFVTKPKLGLKEFLGETAADFVRQITAAAQARPRRSHTGPVRANLPVSARRPVVRGEIRARTGTARTVEPAGVAPARTGRVQIAEVEDERPAARGPSRVTGREDDASAPAVARTGRFRSVDGGTRPEVAVADGDDAVQEGSRRPGPLPAAPSRGADGALVRTTDHVVAIGTSTGGTQALERILTALPRVTPGIVIVQHMPERFTQLFADRLNGLCEIEVREARDGDRVTPGRALIAPGGRHMRLRRSGALYQVEVIDGPPVNRHKPSVDVLFRSVAQVAGRNAVGIIMTGMGDDGARGLLEMHQAGARTVAQDEATCVVFGMPNEAIKLGAVDVEVPLGQIAAEVLRPRR